MKLESITDFLNESELHTFHPFSFPASHAASSVDVTGGIPERGGIQTVYVRIVTREVHPKLAIDKAHEIKEYLFSNLKGAFFDGKTILKVQADTPEPLLIGEDSGLYSVTWNFTILEG